MKWFFALVLVAAPLTALLPPLYTSADEIKGMLSDPQFGKVFDSGEEIQSIVRTDTGFTITTNNSSIDVEVQPLPQRIPGPAKFRYVFKK